MIGCSAGTAMAGKAETGAILGGWISRDDLAQELDVTPVTLARWATDGTGPARVRIGRRVYYRRAAILRWLRDKEKQEKTR